MTAKRLLKDLPFENIKKGTVIRDDRLGSKYTISHGNTYYEGGGSSSNGDECFGDSESEIIKVIWNNPEWFEEAELKTVKVKAKNDSIILTFKEGTICIEDSETLAHAVCKLLRDHLGDGKVKNGGWVWNKFEKVNFELD